MRSSFQILQLFVQLSVYPLIELRKYQQFPGKPVPGRAVEGLCRFEHFNRISKPSKHRCLLLNLQPKVTVQMPMSDK